MNTNLNEYIQQFKTMNCNKYHGLVAPHKAIMLLSVIDCAATGKITNGFVPHNHLMVTTFQQMWDKYIGQSNYFKPIFSTPFIHLATEPFWELMKKDNFEERKEYSLGSLRKNFFGAKISDQLWQLIQESSSRQELKQALEGKIEEEKAILMK